MKEVKIYIANDGTEFTDKDKCLEYEYNNDSKTITDILGDRPKNNEAIQHNVSIYPLWKHFLSLCINDSDKTVSNFARDIYNGIRHKSHLGHYLYRSNNPLYTLYMRFECIDFFNMVEYDQPYYTTHPNAFTGKIIIRT